MTAILVWGVGILLSSFIVFGWSTNREEQDKDSNAQNGENEQESYSDSVIDSHPTRDFNQFARFCLVLSMYAISMQIIMGIVKIVMGFPISVINETSILGMVFNAAILIAGILTFKKNRIGLIALVVLFIARFFLLVPMGTGSCPYFLGGNLVHLFRDFGLFAIAMCFKKNGVSGWKSMFASKKDLIYTENEETKESFVGEGFEDLYIVNKNERNEVVPPNNIIDHDKENEGYAQKNNDSRDFNLVAKILLGLSMLSVLFFMAKPLQEIVLYPYLSAEKDVLEVIFDILIIIAGLFTFFRFKAGAIALIVLFIARMFFAVSFDDYLGYMHYLKGNIISFLRDFGLFAIAMFFKKDGISGWESMLQSKRQIENRKARLSNITKSQSNNNEKNNKDANTTKEQSVYNTEVNYEIKSWKSTQDSIIVKFNQLGKSSFEIRLYKEIIINNHCNTYKSKVQISISEENESVEVENLGDPKQWSKGHYRFEIWYRDKMLYSQIISIC